MSEQLSKEFFQIPDVQIGELDKLTPIGKKISFIHKIFSYARFHPEEEVLLSLLSTPLFDENGVALGKLLTIREETKPFTIMSFLNNPKTRPVLSLYTNDVFILESVSRALDAAKVYVERKMYLPRVLFSEYQEKPETIEGGFITLVKSLLSYLEASTFNVFMEKLKHGSMLKITLGFSRANVNTFVPVTQPDWDYLVNLNEAGRLLYRSNSKGLPPKWQLHLTNKHLAADELHILCSLINDSLKGYKTKSRPKLEGGGYTFTESGLLYLGKLLSKKVTVIDTSFTLTLYTTSTPPKDGQQMRLVTHPGIFSMHININFSLHQNTIPN